MLQGAPLRDFWAEFTRLEETPSMIALNYPPHVTLAVYDSIPVEQLRHALRCELGTLPPFRLTFVKLAFFECPQLVFWAAPEPSEPLSRAHAAIHRRLDPMLCRHIIGRAPGRLTARSRRMLASPTSRRPLHEQRRESSHLTLSSIKPTASSSTRCALSTSASWSSVPESPASIAIKVWSADAESSAQATPARSRSCTCRMPTGLPF
jgi:2'-5' RNA ligase superfamily